MKIMQVTSVFPPHIGGLEKVVYNISKGLAEEGHQVVVFTTNSPRSKTDELKNGIRINRIPVLLTIFGAPIALFLPYFMKEDVDLVHVHIPPVFGAVSSIIFGKMKRVPIVLTFHNDTVGKNSLQSFVARIYNILLAGLILKNVELITVPSQAYNIELKKRGIDGRKIVTINNGIDLSNRLNVDVDKLKQEIGFSEKKVVLFVGALERRKGVEFLIKAFPRVKTKVQDVTLLIVGNGSERTYLENLSRDLGVNEDITFTGHVTDNQLELFYEVADVLVLPSLYESFGLVLLEAMAHGRPVVATRILGVTELVKSGVNGVLVEPRNPYQLVEAVVKVLSETQYARQLGNNGQIFSRKFGWKRVILEYIDVYRECLNRDMS